METPPGTRSIHFELITTEPNHGTAWFDDIRLERIRSEGPRPQAPSLKAETADGNESCLTVCWDLKRLGEAATAPFRHVVHSRSNRLCCG
ncbi:MAG: hypothetical protein HUU20_06810 [Pirellulales bacterium]|nr:hypothetical protein [Pirellulales bacterium]